MIGHMVKNCYRYWSFWLWLSGAFLIEALIWPNYLRWSGELAFGVATGLCLGLCLLVGFIYGNEPRRGPVWARDNEAATE